MAVTVETAIGMRGSAPSSKAAASARGESGNWKGRRRAEQDNRGGRTPRLEIRETVGFRDSDGSIARS